MSELETTYISKINLKNYKSIQNLTIDLHAGLNIIIGQNGSGKTNFVQAVHSIFSESEHHKLPIGFEFGFEFTSPPDKLKKKWTGSVKEMNHQTLKGKKIKYYESKLGKIKRDALFHPDIVNKLPSLESIIIPFTLPPELPYLKQASDFKGSVTEFIDEAYKRAGYFLFEDELGYFESFQFESRLDFMPSEWSDWDESEKDNLEKKIKVDEQLVRHLKHFSPIKDCRPASGYTIKIDENGGIIHHIMLEFLVNNNWYSWNELSDGTKRLFYIISQTINNQSLVMIEEPEIGLHPDQLFRIMDFLKRQSETKQIIITTHSPDVLNILEKDELHQIVITQFDVQQGTLMQHLSPQKMQKALRYMNAQGLELKDFWLHSNLEELDEAK
jgi:predicted ATP-dependent endonuclease of OLD family